MTIPGRIVIRPLRVEDLERLFEPVQRSLGVEWLARQERGEFYVAVAELNGVAIGKRCLDFTRYPGKRIGHVFGAGVQREWQSRGIGSMIDHHLEHVALARGFRAFRSVVAKHNMRAIRWHERLGDRCIGEGLVRWTEPDGREAEVDCWKFERTLGCYCGEAPGDRV